MMATCKQGKPKLADPLSDDCSFESVVREKRASNTVLLMSANKRKLKANQIKLEDAAVVVGIDFGTTYSGFAYARKADPEKIFTFYDWPGQAPAGAKPYCKTQTSLWYWRSDCFKDFDLRDWGWPAHVNHRKALQAKSTYMKGTESYSVLARRPVPLTDCGHFLTKFKLQLAAVGSSSGSQLKGEKLPEGLSAERMVTDYLKGLSVFIMAELEKFDCSILKKDVQWCLTVPTIWTDTSKQAMVKCAQMAGLIHGLHCRDESASLHPIVIVLEPEAASVYCLQKLKNTVHDLKMGSKFLIVDAGGGTVDLVVHEKLDNSGLRVKEVTCSTGDLCGGTFVDQAFMKYLGRKIGCFDRFSAEYPATVLTIHGYWESFKCGFDGQQEFDLELPAKLADAWETHDRGCGFWTADRQYDAFVIKTAEIRGIFDGEVRKIFNLIGDQLAQVPEIEAVMVVGGFSNSPYLMKRIRQFCSHKVKHILSPPDPGSAVCQGAVAFGVLGADIMMSRKSRKTYGIRMYRTFQKGDRRGSFELDDNGEALCKDSFCVFTRIGDDVPVDHCVPHQFVPVNKGEASIKFTMYSTNDPEPEFITDKGVVKVGSWTYSLPPKARRMKEKPQVEVTMYFGRTHIEVSAQPLNFHGGKKSMFSVLFERDPL